jgi:hypothetical protein
LDRLTKQYKANWTRIQILLRALEIHRQQGSELGEKLKGLQKLEDEHIRMLSDWVDDPADYQPNRRESLPWIWKVGRYEVASSTNIDGKTFVEEWEEEGIDHHTLAKCNSFF